MNGMEHSRGELRNMSEIEPRDLDVYVIHERSMLQAIYDCHIENGGDENSPFVMDYVRGGKANRVERQGVVINRSRSSGKNTEPLYSITFHNYLENPMDDEKETINYDSYFYKLVDTPKGPQCTASVMYYVESFGGDQQPMTPDDHEVLLDELYKVHVWQLADQRERDTIATLTN